MKTFSEIIQAASKEVKEIDVYELKDFLDSNHDFHLIDIREDREWVNNIIKKKQLTLYDPSLEAIHHYTPDGNTWKGIE